MKFTGSKTAVVASTLCLLFALGGCSSIQLVSNYDEGIDNQAQKLQKKLDGYLVSLQNVNEENLKYKNQQKFYEDVVSDLNALSVRADGIYKNKITIEQVSLARDNLAYLVLLHKKCITSVLTTEQKKKVQENGIDLSLDCNIVNGATADEKDRGEIKITRALLSPVQKMFNQHFGAIMALELAKKRGEDKAN